MINIKEKIDDYLEFDSSKLFIDESVRIFGGAIRDTIAEQQINDIDILLGINPKSVIDADKGRHIRYNRLLEIEEVLRSEGYIHHSSLSGRDLTSMYMLLSVIHEPRTWTKGKKIVQLIRPSLRAERPYLVLEEGRCLQSRAYSMPDSTHSNEVFGFMNNFIAQVDLSCCGVSYDGTKIYENIQHAVLDCQLKNFMQNTHGLMFNQTKIIYRESKLWQRGWKKIDSRNMQLIRDFKISNLFSDTELEFTKQW